MGSKARIPELVPFAFAAEPAARAFVVTPVLLTHEAEYCADVRGVAVKVMSAH